MTQSDLTLLDLLALTDLLWYKTSLLCDFCCFPLLRLSDLVVRILRIQLKMCVWVLSVLQAQELPVLVSTVCCCPLAASFVVVMTFCEATQTAVDWGTVLA